MSTIQEQMKMYHVVEQVLRQAAIENHPMALRDIYERAEVKSIFPKEYAVRDKVNVLLNHGLVTKVTIAQSASGDKRSRVGYMWAVMESTAQERIDFAHVASGSGRTKHPKRENIGIRHVPRETPTQSVEVEVNGLTVYAGKGVQMFVQGVNLTVDKNPVSGLVRIVVKSND